MNKLSRNAKAAVAKHGANACLKAFTMHNGKGEGASTVANTIDCKTIRTTQQADAAINAGRELYAQGWRFA